MSCTYKLLKGVRILDLTRVLAGPYSTMLMGDLGAEVLKVEDPQSGDVTRSWGPPFVGDQSAYYLSINRNKKSLAINLKSKEGIDLIKKLAEKSDVVIENFLPGKLESLGIGYESLKSLNNKLIYCSITGYGSSGPYANRGGYDVIASSIAGLNHITGPEDGDPCRVGVAMTDLTTGLLAKSSILAALYSRDKTGKGSKIDCNLISTQISALSHIASNYLNCGIDGKRWGTGHPSIVPYQAFKTKDGRFLTVGAGTDKHFDVLCKKLDLTELPADKLYKTNVDRVKNRKKLLAILKQRFETKTCEEWLQAFEGCTFPYGPINNIEGAFSDPQVQHNDMVIEMKHRASERTVKAAGHPVVYSENKSDCENLHPPTLGEHTHSVLSELLQMSDKEIDYLSEIGVIKC